MEVTQTITKSNVNYEFNSNTPPAAYIDSGDSISFMCQDCYAEQIDYDLKEFSLLDMKKNNPITGPLYIREANPGDILKIEILDIKIENYGVMCVRNNCGIYEVDGCYCRRFPIFNNIVQFDKNIKIPIKPMIGVIGTCLKDQIVSTQSPGEHGGNLDIKELCSGSTLYLPVYVPGALLSIGDLHAVQGDGETAICAMEVNGTVTIRATVMKGHNNIPTPFLVTENAFYTTSANESLDVCSIAAARKMHRWLMESFSLTDVEAAMLLSLQGNLRISQVVNPKKGCIMELPKKAIECLK